MGQPHVQAREMPPRKEGWNRAPASADTRFFTDKRFNRHEVIRRFAETLGQRHHIGNALRRLGFGVIGLDDRYGKFGRMRRGQCHHRHPISQHGALRRTDTDRAMRVDLEAAIGGCSPHHLNGFILVDTLCRK